MIEIPIWWLLFIAIAVISVEQVQCRPFVENIFVTTPEEYEQFKRDQVSLLTFGVVIEMEADPDLTMDPKLFTTGRYFKYEYHDANGNGVYIDTADGRVLAYIKTDTEIVQGLPVQCQKYDLNIKPTLQITQKDIEYILQWSRMGELYIRGNNDIIYMLAQQGQKLKVLSELWSLSFELNRSSYSQVELQQFIDNLPALDTIRIAVGYLEKQQIDYFIRKQGKLKNWDLSIVSSYIVVTKKLDIQRS